MNMDRQITCAVCRGMLFSIFDDGTNNLIELELHCIKCGALLKIIANEKKERKQ